MIDTILNKIRYLLTMYEMMTSDKYCGKHGIESTLPAVFNFKIKAGYDSKLKKWLR